MVVMETAIGMVNEPTNLVKEFTETTTIIKTIIDMLKEMFSTFKEVYQEDRKEFWDGILGGIVILMFFLLTMFVLIPIFG